MGQTVTLLLEWRCFGGLNDSIPPSSDTWEVVLAPWVNTLHWPIKEFHWLPEQMSKLNVLLQLDISSLLGRITSWLLCNAPYLRLLKGFSRRKLQASIFPLEVSAAFPCPQKTNATKDLTLFNVGCFHFPLCLHIPKVSNWTLGFKRSAEVNTQEIIGGKKKNNNPPQPHRYISLCINNETRLEKLEEMNTYK